MCMIAWFCNQIWLVDNFQGPFDASSHPDLFDFKVLTQIGYAVCRHQMHKVKAWKKIK